MSRQFVCESRSEHICKVWHPKRDRTACHTKAEGNLLTCLFEGTKELELPPLLQHTLYDACVFGFRCFRFQDACVCVDY